MLADYVLALIRADSSEPELRKSAVDNLEDFLKDSMAPWKSIGTHNLADSASLYRYFTLC